MNFVRTIENALQFVQEIRRPRSIRMGKLSNISGKDASKAFQKAGWQARGQVGSHLVHTKPGIRANLTIPLHSELAPGTLRSLIRTSGLTVEEFLKLL
jgi:predicted RNA binding protein YcfA (HicA-like mRNA interferase family)